MCPVDDHGLEAIRKSAREVTTNDKSNYCLQTVDIDNTTNSFNSVTTTIGTTPTLINIPEKAELVYIVHISTGKTIWLGADITITTSGANVFPLIVNTPLELKFKKGNNNNFYGIVSSGTVTIYVAGVTNE